MGEEVLRLIRNKIKRDHSMWIHLMDVNIPHALFHQFVWQCLLFGSKSTLDGRRRPETVGRYFSIFALLYSVIVHNSVAAGIAWHGVVDGVCVCRNTNRFLFSGCTSVCWTRRVRAHTNAVCTDRNIFGCRTEWEVVALQHFSSIFYVE